MAKRGNGKQCVSSQDCADEVAEWAQKAAKRAAMLRGQKSNATKGDQKPSGTPSKPTKPAMPPPNTPGTSSVASTSDFHYMLYYYLELFITPKS